MTNQSSIGQNKNYDLEERTASFGEAIIEFSKKIPQSPITISLISQLVRAATSIGANYCEADNAESKMDFKHKISLCKKEAKETKYWLRMIAMAIPELKIKARGLWQEAKELNLIFSSIVRKTQTPKGSR
jgi:four helix bundle protein